MAFLIACAQTSDDDAPNLGDAGEEILPPPAPPLCDGSSDIRLLRTGSGSDIAPLNGDFISPYGVLFLAIDGECRFYTNAFDGDYSTGTLTDDEAVRLSKELHWNYLHGWSPGHWNDFCFDGGFDTLGVWNAAFTCYCDCSHFAPAGLQKALERAVEWAVRLGARGEKVTGPVSALLEVQARGDFPDAVVLDWPLSRSITSIPNILGDTGQYARFDDPVEARLLRELRYRIRPTSGNVLVREGEDFYVAHVRDELPDEVADAIRELRATWPR